MKGQALRPLFRVGSVRRERRGSREGRSKFLTGAPPGDGGRRGRSEEEGGRGIGKDDKNKNKGKSERKTEMKRKGKKGEMEEGKERRPCGRGRRGGGGRGWRRRRNTIYQDNKLFQEENVDMISCLGNVAAAAVARGR